MSTQTPQMNNSSSPQCPPAPKKPQSSARTKNEGTPCPPPRLLRDTSMDALAIAFSQLDTRDGKSRGQHGKDGETQVDVKNDDNVGENGSKPQDLNKKGEGNDKLFKHKK